MSAVVLPAASAAFTSTQVIFSNSTRSACARGAARPDPATNIRETGPPAINISKECETEPMRMSFSFPQKKHKLVAVLTANRQFYKFIIITIILPFTHDSEIGPTPLGISARAERPSIYILYKRGSAVTRLRCHRFIQSPHATIVYNSPTTASRAALAGAL